MTGKPISLGGSEGRNEATARGCVYMHRRGRAPSRHRPRRRPRVAVQGFGNAGSIAARLIAEEGATVVAVSDSTGGIHNPDGLDIAKVIGWKSEHGTVQGFPGAERHHATRELLEVDCDILIPAALENQITAAQRRQHQGPAHRRGRQRPDHARGRRDPVRRAACS